jgi:acyl-CoA thioesterase YciA
MELGGKGEDISGLSMQNGSPMQGCERSDGPPQGEPALRAIAMPADANPYGDIFGGWLLSQMDLAGGAAARRRAKGRTATVAITAMTFHRPVFVGDEVTCYAQIIKVGRTSITVKVESWVRRGIGEEQIAVTEGIFTYVAVDEDRRPRPVPEE